MGTPHQFFPTAMKVSLPSLLLLSLTLTLASSASPSPSPCTTALSAAAATTSRDTATLYSLLSPNIQSLFGGTFFTSKSAVLPVFQSLFSAFPALSVHIADIAPLKGTPDEAGACLVWVNLATLDPQGNYSLSPAYVVEFGVLPSGNISRWLEYSPISPPPPSPSSLPSEGECDVMKPVNAYIQGWEHLSRSAVAAQLDSQLTVTQNDQVFPTLSSYLGFVDQVMDMFSTYGLQVAHSADAGNNYVALKVRAFGSTKGQGDTSFVTTALVVAHISPSTCLIDSFSIANTTPFSS